MDAWIKVVTGAPGHGKTLLAVYMMAQYVRQGLPIATNINLTPLHPGYDSIIHLDDSDEFPFACEKTGVGVWDWIEEVLPGGGLLVWDEPDYWIDATEHSKLGRNAKMFVKEHRKMNLSMLLIVQDLKNLWVRARRCAQSFLVARCQCKEPNGLWSWAPHSWSRWVRSEYAGPELLDSQLLRREWDWYGDMVPYYAMYDSSQRVAKRQSVRRRALVMS